MYKISIFPFVYDDAKGDSLCNFDNKEIKFYLQQLKAKSMSKFSAFFAASCFVPN